MKTARKTLASILIASFMLMLLPLPARAEGAVCRIGADDFYTFQAALDALDAMGGGEATVTLLEDIEYSTTTSIAVTGKTVHFDLNGHKLGVTNREGHALTVGAGGVVDITADGDKGGTFSVASLYSFGWGVYAHDGGQATVTNATSSGENGAAAVADGGGSRVVVQNSAEGATGAYAFNFGVVNVNGNVTSSSVGARAEAGGAVTVYGNVSVDGAWATGVSAAGLGSQAEVKRDVTVGGSNTTGVSVREAGTATVRGSVTVTGLNATGVNAVNSNSTAYIGGVISVPEYAFYILLNSDALNARDGVPDGSYLRYSDEVSSVFVTAPTGPLCEIGSTGYDTLAAALKVAVDDADDGAVTTIKLLRDADYDACIQVSGKTVIFDLNGCSLSLMNEAGNGLEVGEGGVVDITDTSAEKDGAFNVVGAGYGVYAHDGGRARVTMAIGMTTGVYAADGGSVHVKGNVYGSVMTGPGAAGVIAAGGGTVTVDGIILAVDEGAVYIKLDEAAKTEGDGVPGTGADEGYLVYSDANGNTVRVATKAVCMIGMTMYESLDAALGDAADGEETTVRLLRSINHNTGIAVEGKTVVFDLNGCALNVTNTEGHALTVGPGGTVDFTDTSAEGDGEFNVAGIGFGFHGAYAHDGGQARVTRAAASEPAGTAACAQGTDGEGNPSRIRVTGEANHPAGLGASAAGGGEVVVDGDALCSGVYANGSGSSVEIKGNVAGSDVGVYSISGGSVTVRGDVAVSGEYGAGVAVADGGTALVEGDVTISGGAGVAGVLSADGGTATINGVLAVPAGCSYIMLVRYDPDVESYLVPGDGIPGTGERAGYLVYADEINFVYVRARVSAALNPTAASFDKNPAKQADVRAAITWNNAKAVKDVKAGGVSIGAANYSVSGNTLTVSKAYLAAKAAGSLVLTVEFNKYDPAELTVAISDTTPPLSAYTHRTLRDAATGVSVSGGGIHESAQLSVTPLDANALPGALREAAAGGMLIAGFEVSLIGGDFQGELTISFPVNALFNGRRVVVLHYVNGRTETHSVLVANGRATVTVYSLSPFAILPEIGAPEPPGTGGSAGRGGFALIGLAALLAGYAAQKRRKA